MSTATYDALPEAVRAIIDRSAPTQAEVHGISLDEAREALALRVKTTSSRGGDGAGH